MKGKWALVGMRWVFVLGWLVAFCAAGSVWGQVKDEELATLAGEADSIVVVTKIKELQTHDIIPAIGFDVERVLKGDQGKRIEGGGRVWGAELQPMPAPGLSKAILFLREGGRGLGWPLYRAGNPTGWFVADSEEMEKKVVESIPLPVEWGDEVNGLKMGLRLRRAQTKPGEDLPVEICIRNVSDKDITLLQHRYNIYDYYPFTRFILERGNRWEASKPVGVMDAEDFPARRTLRPDESYIHTVRLDKWPVKMTMRSELQTWKATTAGEVFAHIDSAKITCAYSVPPKYKNTFWTGTLKSNTVRVKVVGEEAAWGRPEHGVQVSLKAVGAKGSEADGPVLELRVRNIGTENMSAVTDSKWWDVEVDGQWYHCRPKGLRDRTSRVLSAGAEARVGRMSLDRRARLTSEEGEKRLRFRRGKHKVRVAIPVVRRDDGRENIVRVASNSVEVEIVGEESEEVPQVPALTPEETERAAVLLKQFAAEEFAAREKAVEELVAMGPDVLELVQKTMAESTDEEVKLRCRMVVDKIAKAEDAAYDRRQEERRAGQTLKLLGKNPAAEAEAAAARIIKAGDHAFDRKDYEEAQRIYRFGVDGDWAKNLEERNYCRYRVGRCQERLEDKAGAFATYKALIDEVPYSDWAGEAMLCAQEMYWTQGGHDAAIRVFERLLEANPKGRMRPYLMEQMAFNYIMKSDYDKAEEILKQVIKEYAGVDPSPARPEGLHVAYAKDYLQMIKDKKRAEAETRDARERQER